MAIEAMNSLRNQMQTQINQISSVKQSHLREGNNHSVQFSDILSDGISNISDMQKSSKQLAEDYMTGSTTAELNDVMISIQKSSIALNLGVQVRNKLVSAYQDVMNMSV